MLSLTPNLVCPLRRKDFELLCSPPKNHGKQRSRISGHFLHIFGTPASYFLIFASLRPRSDGPILPSNVDVRKASIMQYAVELFWSSKVEADFDTSFNRTVTPLDEARGWSGGGFSALDLVGRFRKVRYSRQVLGDYRRSVLHSIRASGLAITSVRRQHTRMLVEGTAPSL